MSPYRPYARTLAIALLLIPTMNLQAATPPPSVDFESMLDSPFHAGGRLRVDEYNLVFAPPAPVQAQAEVVDASGKVLASHAFFPEYRFTDKAFGRLQVSGPGEVQLPGPGDYALRFTVNGARVGELPFTARTRGSGDAFDGSQTWTYGGPWSQWGYLILRPYKEIQAVDAVFWTGADDLPAGAQKDGVEAQLLRGGTLVAQSRRNVGQISNQHFKREKLSLFHPHEIKNVNPLPFSLADLMVDGKYELRLSRKGDQARLRSFRLQIRDGKPVAHPRTAFGYTPAHGYIAPRVLQKNVNLYGFQEAIWMESQ